MMFEINKRTIKINEEEYELRPLSGRFLPKLYQVMGKFEEVSKNTDDKQEVMKAFDEKTTENLHSIALETFKKSYPDRDETILDEFVTQNLLVILENLIQVNMPNKEE